MDIGLERLFHSVKNSLLFRRNPKMRVEFLFFNVQHLLITSVEI